MAKEISINIVSGDGLDGTKPIIELNIIYLW